MTRKPLDSRKLEVLRTEPLSARNRFARAMQFAGVTQVEVAEALRMTQPHVSAICSGRYGKKGLPTETSRLIAEFFGATIEDIFPAERAEAVAS